MVCKFVTASVWRSHVPATDAGGHGMSHTNYDAFNHLKLLAHGLQQ